MSERTIQRHLVTLKESGVLQSVKLPIRDAKDRLVAWRDGFLLKLNGVEMAPEHDYSACPPWLRTYVIEVFELTCVYCHGVGDLTTGPDGRPWEIDRIKPGSKGGRYEAGNVTLSCRKCNTAKGSSDKSAASLEEKIGGRPLQEGAKLAPRGAKTGISEGANLSPYKEPSVLQPSVESKPLLASQATKSRFKDFHPTPTLQERDREVHPIRYLLTRFDLAFLAKTTERHPPFTGKEAKTAENLIKHYGIARASEMVDMFFQLDDEFVKEAGLTFNLFKGAIGKIIVKQAKQTSLRHPGINAGPYIPK